MQVQDVGVAEVTFGQWLQRRRKALDLTQADLGRRVGCAAVTIHKIERGQLRPSRDIAERLANELQVPEVELADFLRLARNGGQSQQSLPLRHPPVLLTSFVGRARELEEVQRLIRGTRLLTLTGTGGVGKTRLALEAARLLAAEDRLTVVVAELSAATEPSGVELAVAASLGLREQTSRSLRAAILDLLKRKQPLLLVLDNCEQVVGAVAELAQAVLTTCEGVRILATSRERLGLLGETTWRVPSMAVPAKTTSVAALQESDAARLFVERAAVLVNEFVLSQDTAAAITSICAQVDGIPLAIELAAARIQALSPEQIADLLPDSIRLLNSGNRTAPPRQQTLEATFEWSYRLLTQTEQTLLRRVAAFSSGWSLEAAELVCIDDQIPADDIVELLTRLAEKSLVVVEQRAGSPVRYRLHEPLRHFLIPRLTASPDAASVRTRHADYFSALARNAAEHYHGPRQAAELNRIEREHANVTQALRWLDEQGDVDQLDRFVTALWWFWLRRNHLQEGRAWLQRLIERAALSRPPVTRSLLLMHVATIAWLQGDFAAAQKWNEESVALSNEHGDVVTTAYALGLEGRLAVVRGDFAAGRTAFQKSLELISTVGDFWWEGRVREGLATVALQYGDFSGAAFQLEHAIALARKTGDDWSLATLLTGLGDVSRARGTYQRAGELYAESEALHRRLGTEPAPTLRHNQAYVALHAGNLRDAHNLFNESLRLYQSYSEQRGMAECLVGLAGVAAASGDRSRAATLLGAADAGFDAVLAQISSSNRGDFSRVTALARAGWTAAEFKAAWTAGYAAGLDTAVAATLAVNHVDADEPRFTAGPLSDREGQVAALIAHGASNRQIARSLNISEATVERHMANIFRKLGARSRAQVATWATQQGLLQAFD